MKRLAFLWLTVIVAVYFCFTCFFCPSIPALAAGAGSDGGGGYRGNYTELNRADIDTEKTQGEISGNFWEDIFGGNGKEVLDDLFCYAVGSIGAIFSDDTTLSSVKNQWNAIYANALESPEEMRKIFYYGTDGQLYFTDEFLKNTRDIVDQTTFNQGIVSIPCTTCESFYQDCFGIGCLHITNTITSCLTGEDIRYMAKSSSGSKDIYVNLGFSVKDKYTVAPFNSYSSYRDFCNRISYENPRGSYVVCSFYDFGNQLISFDSIQSYWSTPTSSGEFVQSSSKNCLLGGSQFNTYPSISYYRGFNEGGAFVGVGSFEAYRSKDWLDFYTGGGTGVIRGNTYYKFDNAVNPDELANGSAIYKQFQDHYKTLAEEVKAGNKTLSEINQILSDEILDVAENIEQNTAVQANYLKKILDELKKINRKLTYSNIVDTVGAAASLFDALSNAFDGLFSDGNSVVSSLTDLLNDKLKSAFSSRFPFSIYRDFEIIVNSLAHEPVEPPLEYRLYLPRYNIDYVFNFSNSVDSGGGHRVDFDSFKVLSDIMHFFSSVIFVYGLFNVTMDYVNSFKE